MLFTGLNNSQNVRLPLT